MCSKTHKVRKKKVVINPPYFLYGEFNEIELKLEF